MGGWPFSTRQVPTVKAVILVAHTPATTIRHVVLEPWGQPFELSAGTSLRFTAHVTSAEFFWETVVEGEYLMLYTNNIEAVTVEEKVGAAWVQVWDA